MKKLWVYTKVFWRDRDQVGYSRRIIKKTFLVFFILEYVIRKIQIWGIHSRGSSFQGFEIRWSEAPWLYYESKCFDKGDE